MPRLILHSEMGRMMSRLPHKILINGQLVGLMNTPTAAIDMPAGRYRLTIGSMVPMLSSTAQVELNASCDTHVAFGSRERVWDILFSIDLLLCIAKLFITFPQPWNTVYEVVTNGFFVVWLIYEWCIRNRYYRLNCYQTLNREHHE